jgi:hypothetical protein
MRLSVRLRAIATSAVAVAAGACGESTGPVGPLVDPSSLRASLALVDTVFSSPIVRAVGFFSFGVPLPTAAAGASLIPDSLLGKTFTWSCATQTYAVSGDTGAPATGVRFMLYALAPAGSIACPATTIGQLDLFDASTAGTRAMHAVATSVGGLPLVDYTLSQIIADPSRASSATGSVGDGQHRLSFQQATSLGSGPYNVIATVQLDDSAADLHEVLHDTEERGVDTYSDDLDLTVRRGSLAVQLTGSTGWANTFVSWNEILAVNAIPFAKVTGSVVPQGTQPTITPLSGMPFFTSEQRQLVLDVVATPDTISRSLYRVLSASARLVSTP